jgi:hypothetical protein
MLRKFAAALLASTLVAGTAFAAEPSGNAGATAAAPAGATASVKADAAKTVKTVKHAHKSARKHFARGKVGMKQAHHVKAGKTHQAKLSHQPDGAGSAKRS